MNGFGSYNPLTRATEKGLSDAIECWLEGGANPNVPNTVRFASCCIHHKTNILGSISSIAPSNTQMHCCYDVIHKHDAMQECSYGGTSCMC